MKNTCLVILSIVLIGCNRNAEKQTSISSVQLELVKNYTTQFPENTQLSIAVFNDVDEHFFGFIVGNDTLYSIDNRDSVFEIGSITKVFTSTLLSRLILDGSIKINEPIENVLPFPLHVSAYENSKVSAKNLSNHTSGFPDFPSDYQTFSEDIKKGNNYDSTALKDYLKNELLLKSMPEKEYSYSNLGYATLGYAIEHNQKENYEKLLQKWICEKYDLISTTTDFNKIRDFVVPGRDSLGNKLTYIDWEAYKPAGGIFSNAFDLTRFVQANFGPDTILAYQRRETYSWGNFGMALGWEIWKIGNNCAWYSKSGAMDGYRSDCIMDLSSKCAVIVLSNLSAQHPNSDHIDKLANDFLKLEYLRIHKNDSLGNAFIEIALKNGWGEHRRDSLRQTVISKNSISGVWQQNNVNKRIVTKTFFPDSKFQTDFFGDTEMDVWGYYEVKSDTIVLKDIGGAACPNEGIYQFELTNDTLRFIPILDNCDGRKIGFSGSWSRMAK